MEGKSPEARCGTVVACLALIIIGQAYFLRGILFAGVGSWPIAIWIELIFCVIMLGAIIWCWGHPKGWSTNQGCIAVFIVYGLYLVFNVINYTNFSNWYLQNFQTEYPSTGKALVAFKLLLAVFAVIAGIPAAPAPDAREYSQKLKEATLRQQAEWAKGGAVGAKKDLEATLAKLRNTLSKEEMDALMAELNKTAAAAPAQAEEKPSVREEWNGWGGGV